MLLTRILSQLLDENIINMTISHLFSLGYRRKDSFWFPKNHEIKQLCTTGFSQEIGTKEGYVWAGDSSGGEGQGINSYVWT